MLLATEVAQFTAKATNSEKAIYVMCCSINKLKFQMLISCKNFMFSVFTWKKKLLPEMVGWEYGGGSGTPCPPFSTTLKVLMAVITLNDLNNTQVSKLILVITGKARNSLLVWPLSAWKDHARVEFTFRDCLCNNS